MTRRMIAALQVSLDGYAQGSDRGGEEWVDSWADALGLLSDVDAFVQGAGMFPGYAAYWAAIEAAPEQAPPFQARVPYPGEVAYAKLAAEPPHYVVSTTLDGVSWPKTAQIVRDLSAIALLNAGLLDELRLIVHPLLLGGGKPLFAGVTERRQLRFAGAEPATAGRVVLSYLA